MNKVLVAATTAALVAFSQIPAVAATPRVNAKCSSVGVVYEDLKCTKVKTKKLWTSIKFVPWSDNFNLAAMSKVSQANFAKWVDGYSNVGQVEYYTDIDDSDFLKSYLYSAKSVEGINPNAKIIFSETNESAKAIIQSKNISLTLRNGMLCPQTSGLIGCNSFQNVGIIILNNMNHSIFTESTLPHENFHSVQAYLAKLSPSVQRNIPIWFMEGTADYFGYMSYANANKKKYYSIRKEIDLGPSTTGKLSDYNSYSPNPYNIGRVAVEYLTASKGFDSVVQVFADYGNGISFEESFKKQFGMTVQDFYDKFLLAKNKVKDLVK